MARSEKAQLQMLVPEQAPKGDRQSVRLDQVTADDDLPGPAPTAALIESIKTFGVLQPIAVVCEKGEFQVVDGRRRVKAARAAGLERIEAVVFLPDDLPDRNVVVLALNALRSDNPISELEAIEALLKRGAGMKAICQATGLPKATVDKRMRLKGLIRPIRKALTSGKIAVSVAEGAAGLPEHMQKQLAEVLPDGKITAAMIHDAKSVRRQDAIGQVPMGVFASDPPEDWREAVVRMLNAALAGVPETEGSIRDEINRVVFLLQGDGAAGAWVKEGA